MIEENMKKGTASVRKQHPKTTHIYLNKVTNTCLTLFAVSIIFMCLGKYMNLNTLIALGMGIGFSGAIIQTKINLIGDEEDE